MEAGTDKIALYESYRARSADIPSGRHIDRGLSVLLSSGMAAWCQYDENAAPDVGIDIRRAKGAQAAGSHNNLVNLLATAIGGVLDGNGSKWQDICEPPRKERVCIYQAIHDPPGSIQ